LRASDPSAAPPALQLHYRLRRELVEPPAASTAADPSVNTTGAGPASRSPPSASAAPHCPRQNRKNKACDFRMTGQSFCSTPSTRETRPAQVGRMLRVKQRFVPRSSPVPPANRKSAAPFLLTNRASRLIAAHPRHSLVRLRQVRYIGNTRIECRKKLSRQHITRPRNASNLSHQRPA